MPDYSLVPVDHQPDFNDLSFVPVDHDPFAADDAVQQPQSKSALQSDPAFEYPKVQEAQWTAFVRPPVIFPRPLRPLEEISPGSAGGSNAGKRFSPKQDDQPEGTPCFYCNTPTPRAPGPDRFNGDHNIPRSQGGNNSPENHISSCQTCNLNKGARTPEEWYKFLQSGA